MAPAEHIPVSVVLVTYNSADYLSVCLDELGRSRGVDLEVIVVDNESKDASAEIAEAHPVVDRVIRTGANLGCAGGNNVGWRAATKPYFVMLNADCAVEPDAIHELCRVLRDEESVGVAGAKLLYPHSRTIQHVGGILHPNAMAEHPGVREEDAGQHDEDRDVDYVTGALAAFRRADLEALGGFDEDFWPAYYEESDICFRMRRSGKKVRYVHTAVGYHWESVELGMMSPALVRMSYRSRMIFIVKNTNPASFFAGFLPFELRWFFGPFARGYRLPVLRSYVSGAKFAARCLARLRRRPRGVRNKLP